MGRLADHPFTKTDLSSYFNYTDKVFGLRKQNTNLAY